MRPVASDLCQPNLPQVSIILLYYRGEDVRIRLICSYRILIIVADIYVLKLYLSLILSFTGKNRLTCYKGIRDLLIFSIFGNLSSEIRKHIYLPVGSSQVKVDPLA